LASVQNGHHEESILATTLKLMSSSKQKNLEEPKSPSANHSPKTTQRSALKANRISVTERKRSKSSPQALTIQQSAHIEHSVMNAASNSIENGVENVPEEVITDSSPSASETTLRKQDPREISSTESDYTPISLCHEVEQTKHSTQNDDVFLKSSSPTPKPKKRTRLPTAPKVSPKPKPRRATLATQPESKLTTGDTEQASTASIDEGKLKVHRETAQEEPQLPAVQKPPYVNIEMRVKNRKPPPSPPRKHSLYQDTNSPGTGRRSVPPVAPKPMPPKRQ